MINIKNLTKSFENKLILDINELVFSNNECIIIIGKNGVGKSILLEMIADIRKPSSGTIEYNFDFKNSPREKIGFLSQSEDATLEMLNALDYINFYKELYSIDQDKIDNVITKFNLTPLLKTTIRKLSPGQKKRLDIAFAVINNPEILILDEFSTGMDVEYKNEVYDYLSIAIKNKLTLISTHEPKEIEMFADKVIFIEDKGIKKMFTKKEIIEKYNNDFEQFLIDTLRGENELNN